MRYEPVTSDVNDTLNSVQREYFPELVNVKILCVFNTRKKESRGKLVLAEIWKPSEFEKYLTLDETEDTGYDYIMAIDKKAWQIASNQDKIRLVRHELRHTFIKDNSKDPYRIRAHSIEDFYSEVRLNEDDPRWAQKLVGQVVSAYSVGDSEDEE